MTFKLPPPPQSNDLKGPAWQDWFFKLGDAFTRLASIAWSAIDFTGSNLTDLETKNHNDLDNIQGGAAGDYYHLTADQLNTATRTSPVFIPEDGEEDFLPIPGPAGSQGEQGIPGPPGFAFDDGGEDADSWLLGLPATDLSMFNVENGFTDSTASTLSFVDGTRTFTITPTGAGFEAYSYGNRFTKSAADSLVIANTEGLHFIYFDATGTLQEQTSVTDDLITSKCFITMVYWDATNAKHLLLGNERHGRVMDSRTHLYLHHTRGTVYESGLGLSGINADASGNLDSSAQFQVASGIIWDEDIKLTITDGSPQTLSPLAQIPVYYKTGVNGDWRRIAASNFPLAYANVGTRPDWNQFTGGAWQLTEVGNHNYSLMHYFATNDSESNQIIGIVGQAEYSTQAQARAGALVELLSLILTGLPSVEFVAIASVIWQTSNAYSNTPKARIRTTDTGASYIDWRTVRLTASAGAGSGSEWGLITGTLSAQTDLQAALDLKANRNQLGAYFAAPSEGEEDFPMMIPGPKGADGTGGSGSLDKWVLIFAAAHG